MKLTPSIIFSLGIGIATAASNESNSTAASCRRDGNLVCCMGTIVTHTRNSQTNTTNVCCDGSVVGRYNTSGTNLLDLYNDLTCCQGDSSYSVSKINNATTCTAGSPTPMRSIAASQGVGRTSTSTSSGLGYQPTVPAVMASVVMMGGAYALAAWAL